MLLTTTDEMDGWLKTVVSPAPMLKLCQFSPASGDVVMARREPLTVAAAEPLCTVMPVGLASDCQPRPSSQTPINPRQSKKSKRRIFINYRPVTSSNFRLLAQGGTLQVGDNWEFISFQNWAPTPK